MMVSFLQTIYPKKFFTMKQILVLLFFTSVYIQVSAQKFFLNTLIGTANYQGDLQDKRFSFNQARLAFGAGVTYEVSDKFSVRAGLTLAKVGADDKKNAKVFYRNLNFTSPITELHLAGEYYLLNPYEHSLAPYLFGGLAVYHFNPYTRDSLGAKYYLRPLSTEGEGFYQNKKNYSLTQLAIPFGAGIRLSLSENIRVGLEVGMRKLFTDYLDDVSTNYVDQNLLLANRGAKAVELAYRGNELKNGAPYPAGGEQRGSSKYKDWYYFTGLTTSIRLGSGNNSRGGRSGIGCPAKVY